MSVNPVVSDHEIGRHFAGEHDPSVAYPVAWPLSFTALSDEKSPPGSAGISVNCCAY